MPEPLVTYLNDHAGGAQIAVGVVTALLGVGGVLALLHPRTTAALWPTGGKQ